MVAQNQLECYLIVESNFTMNPLRFLLNVVESASQEKKTHDRCSHGDRPERTNPKSTVLDKHKWDLPPNSLSDNGIYSHSTPSTFLHCFTITSNLLFTINNPRISRNELFSPWIRTRVARILDRFSSIRNLEMVYTPGCVLNMRFSIGNSIDPGVIETRFQALIIGREMMRESYHHRLLLKSQSIPSPMRLNQLIPCRSHAQAPNRPTLSP